MRGRVIKEKTKGKSLGYSFFKNRSKVGTRFFLEAPLFLFFKQYNKFFLKLKLFFKQLKKKKVRGVLEKLGRVLFFKKVKNSRMGKGVGKFKGVAWRGLPGTPFILFQNLCKSFFFIFLKKIKMWFKPAMSVLVLKKSRVASLLRG